MQVPRSHLAPTLLKMVALLNKLYGAFGCFYAAPVGQVADAVAQLGGEDQFFVVRQFKKITRQSNSASSRTGIGMA